MALIKLKPTSAGRRHAVKVVNPELHKGKPFAALVEKKNRGSGRNNFGRITVRHQGGGHKKAYRIIVPPVLSLSCLLAKVLTLRSVCVPVKFAAF